MPAIPAIAPYALPDEARLPENTATWTVAPDRAVLLIHDMQRFFLRFFPAASEPAEGLVANAVRLRDQARSRGLPVAYTAQPGAMSDAERGLLKDFWGPGMAATAMDREIVDPLAPGPADWLLTKWRYSAFHRTNLLERMREAGRDQLVVCGVYAHVGVLATVIDAFSNDIQPFIAADAVADFTADHHLQALSYAAQRCAVVATTDEIVKALS